MTRDRDSRLRRAVQALVVTMVLVAALAGAPATPAGAGVARPGEQDQAAGGRRTYTGTIDGAEYRVEMPEQWNGTLVLYSHGYFPPQFPAGGLAVTNSPEAESWLLDHGVALAASNFTGVTGYQVDQGYRDQLALLDWFRTHVGEPTRTIATGQSMGGSLAVLLAERNPDLFDGVATVCAGYDPQSTFNAGLDVTFAVKTLLAPGEDIDLVRARDPEASTQLLAQAVERATATPEGRARLALVASLNNITGWWSALAPRPTDPDEVVRQQANWILNAYVSGFAGPTPRVDLEAKAGGNPSSNVGVDYRHQLARSGLRAQVVEAYRAAGLDLAADVDRLNAAPRIAADPAAVDFMLRTSVPTGDIAVPVVTLHSVGDGGAPPDQERWYGHQVRRHGGGGLIRQLYVERGQHCSFSAADEVVALQAVLERIDTGRWPSTSPHRSNEAVAAFEPAYQVVTDLSTWPFPRAVMPPAFVRYTPPWPLRPTR